MRARRGLLWSIFAVALGLRLWGIAFGLPLWSNYYVRPDESLIVEPALRVGQDPRFVNYPALMSLVTGAVFALYHAAARLGDTSVPSAIAQHAARDFSPFFLLARLVSAVAGAAIVFPVSAAAAAVAGPLAGLFAAGLIAVAPLAVREAHYGVTDTLLVFCLALVLWRLLALAQARQRRRDLVALGVCCGLAAAAKYTAVFIAPAVLVGILITGRRTWMTDLAVVTSIAGAMFVVINPYLFLHVRDTIDTGRMLYWASFVRPGAAGAWTLTTGTMNLWRPLSHGPALWLGLPLTLAGLAWTTSDRSRRVAGVIGCAAAVGIGSPIFFGHVVPHRYVLPMIPLVAVFSGVALSVPKTRGPQAVMMALAALLTGAGAWQSARHDRILAREDTRSEAGRWIAANVPAGCPIVMWSDPEAEPQLHESPASIDRRIEFVARQHGQGSVEIISRPYRLARGVAVHAPPGTLHDVYRRVSPAAGSCLATVVTGFPGFAGMRRAPADAAQTTAGERVAQASFSPFAPGVTSAVLEPFDAFYVPFDALDRVTRPGPVIEIALYRR